MTDINKVAIGGKANIRIYEYRRQTVNAQMNRISIFPGLGSAMRYVAYAADLSGVARAVYEIDSPTDDDAKKESRKFLEAHPAVEIWASPSRVARLVRPSLTNAVQ